MSPWRSAATGLKAARKSSIVSQVKPQMAANGGGSSGGTRLGQISTETDLIADPRSLLGGGELLPVAEWDYQNERLAHLASHAMPTAELFGIPIEHGNLCSSLCR